MRPGTLALQRENLAPAPRTPPHESAMSDRKETLHIFLSYAAEDQAFASDLLKHLAPFRRDGAIEIRRAADVLPGEPSSKALEYLAAAELIICLVSPDFLASDYLQNVEMASALERSLAGQATVVPVLVRPTAALSTSSIGELTAIPLDGEPVSHHSDQDDAWANVLHDLASRIPAFGSRVQIAERSRPETALHSTPRSRLALVALAGLAITAAVVYAFRHPDPPRNESTEASEMNGASTTSAANGRQVSKAAASTQPTSAAGAGAPIIGGACAGDDAEQPYCSYRGSLRDAGGAPVVDAEVALIGTSCSRRTDSQGVFDFYGCEPSTVRRLRDPRVYISHIAPHHGKRACDAIPLLKPPTVTIIHLESDCHHDEAGGAGAPRASCTCERGNPLCSCL
jgi:hypothetical protein